ncbi:MAG: hypothetical protein A2075_00040 [Geobacteraceae bacterium GWC2_58_44]|nr:MAG: hypothetical protein A2075_00040 [Geobacteraceae bacterium GWC2_58_44]
MSRAPRKLHFLDARDMKKNSLKIRILVPLAFALFFLLGAFSLISYRAQQKELSRELAEKVRMIENLYHEHEEHETQKLGIALEAVTMNHELTAALKARDRNRIYKMTAPFFDWLRSNYNVTHFYFSDPDRVNILRVHQPGRHGDRTDRLTMLEAQRTGRQTHGAELGPLGTYTLRVVKPWRDGKGVVGYVELGQEVGNFIAHLKRMKKIIDCNTHLFIHKDFIQREEWEAGIRMLGGTEKWGHFADTVSIDERSGQVPEAVLKVMAQKHTLHPMTDVTYDGRHYRVTFIPLIDAGKREVGYFSILYDMTDRVSAFRSSLMSVGITYLLVGGALVAVFYTIIGRIEKELTLSREKLLEEKEALRESEGIISTLNTELESTVEKRTRELLEAQEELVRKEKLSILGQLSGSVGHELRNPLGIMNNAVYFLQTVLADADQTTKEYLEIIKHEIDNSQRIITDLLDFARTRTPQAKAVSAHELVNDCVGRCAIPENVELRTDLPDPLLAVRVDPLQMGQVLQNLVTNGVQAMPDGGALRIAARRVLSSEFGVLSSNLKSETLGTESEKDAALTSEFKCLGSNSELKTQNSKLDGDFIEISVADTGEGIAPENMKKLFQPLFTTKAKGIGLGLVVCRNLVEANGGSLEVASRLGEGTTFAVLLPAERGES